jgi:hypothetical protein
LPAWSKRFFSRRDLKLHIGEKNISHQTAASRSFRMTIGGGMAKNFFSVEDHLGLELNPC